MGGAFSDRRRSSAALPSCCALASSPGLPCKRPPSRTERFCLIDVSDHLAVGAAAKRPTERASATQNGKESASVPMSS